MSVLISCEFGGDLLPPQLLPQYPVRPKGDVAAKYIAERISNELKFPLVTNDFSSQLIDVSRSLKHRNLFTKESKQLSSSQRESLVDTIHQPYRQRIVRAIERQFRTYQYVIHLSIRTFDLMHKGEPRRTDVGLLYDPAVDDEVDFCLDWIDEMYDFAPMLKVRRNYPGRGTTDSITKAMREHFSGHNYIGVEVRMNRAWAGRDVPLRDEAIDGMCEALAEITTLSQSDAA